MLPTGPIVLSLEIARHGNAAADLLALRSAANPTVMTRLPALGPSVPVAAYAMPMTLDGPGMVHRRCMFEGILKGEDHRPKVRLSGLTFRLAIAVMIEKGRLMIPAQQEHFENARLVGPNSRQHGNFDD